jgi:hypothetical protein
LCPNEVRKLQWDLRPSFLSDLTHCEDGALKECENKTPKRDGQDGPHEFRRADGDMADHPFNAIGMLNFKYVYNFLNHEKYDHKINTIGIHNLSTHLIFRVVRGNGRVIPLYHTEKMK